MNKSEVTVTRTCGQCQTLLGTFTAPKENLMLSSRIEWCPKCQANTHVNRDVAGRRESIEKEIKTYPKKNTTL